MARLLALGRLVLLTLNLLQQISSCYDPDADRVVVAYKESSSTCAARVGTVSGTNISFGSAVSFNSAQVEFTSTVYDTNSNKVPL